MSAVDETAQPLAVPTPSPRRRRRAVAAAVPVGAGLAAVLLAANGQGWSARWVLVVLSMGLATSSAIPSIQAVRTDPASLQPLTWGIWAALTALAAVASAVADDWPSAIFSTIGTAACATVTIVVLRLGKHTFTARDALCLALGIAGLIGWQTLQQPQLAVLAACAGDLAALAPTIMHAWRRPREEPTASFALIAAGGLCTAAAAWGHWTITALAYPLYVAVSTGAVSLLTLRRRPAIRPSQIIATPLSGSLTGPGRGRPHCSRTPPDGSPDLPWAPFSDGCSMRTRSNGRRSQT